MVRPFLNNGAMPDLSQFLKHAAAHDRWQFLMLFTALGLVELPAN